MLFILISGSSPWARGTHLIEFFKPYLNRFIPVGTGNTIEATQGEERKAVHPRGHGEHHDSRNHHHEYTGSSPWARGTLKLNKAQQYVHAVHPRGHGEHLAKVNSARFIDGSSPWARGTRTNGESGVSELGFIPVGTGNTHRCHDKR